MTESNNIVQSAVDESSKITNKDLTQLAIRSVWLQGAFNFERMQAGGWLNSLGPFLKKVHKDDPQRLKDSMAVHLDFINTQPVMSSFLMGLILSLEEKKESLATIRSIKAGLFGPLAGIGDAIFWFTILPIVIGVTSSMAISGNVLGPLLFFIIYLGIFSSRIFWTKLGYNVGVSALDKIQQYSGHISRAATILGVTVAGGLISMYVKLNVNIHIPVPGSKNIVDVQKSFFDAVLPSLLPLLYTFLMYWLLRHKNVKATYLILGTIIFALLGSAIGLL